MAQLWDPLWPQTMQISSWLKSKNSSYQLHLIIRLNKSIWLRYIDDIYTIWTHGVDALHSFHAHMNSIHETIKFEMTFSKEEVPFLDTLTSINNHGCLDTSLYKKPTDICSLLHADSFHPSKCKTGMIYSQALRYRRIISSDEKLKTSLQNLQNDLLLRGCNLAMINKQFEKVQNISQNEALCSATKPENDTFYRSI